MALDFIYIMAVATVEFDTPHFLQSLFGHNLSLLKELESRFGVRVTTRDGWMRFEGGAGAVEAAQRLFRRLEKARRNGVVIDASVFRMLLKDASADQASADTWSPVGGTISDGGRVKTSGADQTDGSGGSGGSSPTAGAISAENRLTEVKAPDRGDEVVEDLRRLRLLAGSRKGGVVGRTPGQLAYLNAMAYHELVFGIGPAGTGKTYLAMARALDALKNGEVRRLVLTRPAVEAGEALGFLPGDFKDKVLPYLRPLYDALYDMLPTEEAERLIERGIIEVAPLAYMRGRTLGDAFVILDEGQNTTPEQMFMFLTRLGEGSRCVVTGDPSQVDLRRGLRSGLAEALEILHDCDGIAMVHFDPADVVRHPLVQRIIESYDAHRRSGEYTAAQMTAH